MWATINAVTRSSASGGSCIDNIITNLDPADCTAYVVSFCTSDHKAQVICFEKFCPQVIDSSRVFIRKFSEHNKERFLQEFSQVDWNSFFKGTCVNEQFCEFNDLFLKLFNKNFPIVPVKLAKLKEEKKWLTNDILVAEEELKDWYHVKCLFPGCFL